MFKNQENLLIFEKITGFYQEGQEPFVSCNNMNCCLQKYTTHQFTHCIYYLHQDNFKYSRIMKIHQVHQKLHTKQF